MATPKAATVTAPKAASLATPEAAAVTAPEATSMATLIDTISLFLRLISAVTMSHGAVTMTLSTSN